jgi:hypothetical protein
VTTRPLPLLMFWIPPNRAFQIRDGGRWLTVSHTGDEMMPVEWSADGVFHFADGVRWSVASSGDRRPNTEEISGV